MDETDRTKALNEQMDQLKEALTDAYMDQKFAKLPDVRTLGYLWVVFFLCIAYFHLLKKDQTRISV